MKKKFVIYLASPYSHRFRIVRWWRARQIRRIMAKCINEQNAIVPISPIALTHNLDQLCPDVKWIEDFDIYLLAIIDAVIFVEMPGYKASIGMKKELDYCVRHGIPYTYAKPEKILVACWQLWEICQQFGKQKRKY